MKKISRVLALVMAVLMVMSLAACKDKEAQNAQVIPNVYTLKGPTGMGMAQMISENKTDAKYNFTVAASPEEITTALVSGDADIAACPVNLASVLYNKTQGGVKILALNTLGVTYILTNGVEVNTLEDLRGKTIVSAGQGATPEYIITKLLTDSGMEVGKDVFVEFKSEHADVASLLVSGEAQIALLPEPNVTSSTVQNKDVKVSLDLTKEWETKYGTKLVQGCVVARTAFVEENPDAVKAFLDNYKKSVDAINLADDNAAKMIVEAGIIPKEPIAKKAIPTSYITFIAGEEMKTLTKENLQVLFEANSKSVGGALPGDDFYYTQG